MDIHNDEILVSVDDEIKGEMGETSNTHVYTRHA